MNDNPTDLARAVRRARGLLDMSEAARRSGVSRQWWLDIEKGTRRPTPDKLAQAIIGVGGNLVEVFAVAGYDPEPYMDAAEAGEDVLASLAAEIRGLRSDVQRMGAAVERLAGLPPVPPDQ